MEAAFCVEALEGALAHNGKPDVFNTDQGSQVTSQEFTGVLLKAGISISMDGKGSWRDNVFIERLWRSIKYEEVYLKVRPGAAERPQELAQRRPAAVGGCRGSARRAAVLRLLRGEDLETVSRSLGVTAATLSDWRDAFLAAGEAALATRPTDGEALESERLKARLGRDADRARTAGGEDRRPGGRPPFGPRRWRP